MFERLTEAAAQAVRLAKEEANGSNASLVETDHLLIGLLPADPALCVRVNMDIGLIRKDSGSVPPSFQSLNHECKRVLAYSAEEAEQSGHQLITCRHLALGILREKYCSAAKLLRDQGITREILKEGMIL